MPRTALLAALLALGACAPETASTDPGLEAPPQAAAAASGYDGSGALAPLDSLLRSAGVEGEPASFAEIGDPARLTPPEELFGGAAPEGRFVARTQRAAPGQLMGPVALQTVGAVVRMANEVNGVVGIPHDVVVGTGECVDEDGDVVANAFYDPAEREIVICDELVRQMDGWFGGEPGAHDLKQGALEFIVGHEMGHALVDLLELPVLGRNEDAADLLAVYFSLLSGDVERAAGGMTYFLASGLAREEAGRPLAFWGVHSLDEQRVVTIGCMLHGAAPGGTGWLVESGLVPPRRAESCPREWARAVRDVEGLLGPYRRDG